MILVLRHAFEQAVLHADVLWNDTVHFVVGLITQAIENFPFRGIDGGAEKVIEEDHGSLGGSICAPTLGGFVGVLASEQSQGREDAYRRASCRPACIDS